LDNDGNALLIGALYFNTTSGVMKVYTASGWIAASSASVATLATFEFVATAGQTVFTGADANSATLSYVAPALIVTLNGVRLRPGDDYTATNGTSITLVSAAALNDELVVDAFGSFLVANAVDLTTTQTIGGTKTFSNPITASAGTVSAPGITTTGDSNTGIFFPAADTIAFTEGGTEVMRIDSAGNVGVGITPDTKFEVSGSGAVMRVSTNHSTSGTLDLSADATAAQIKVSWYNSAVPLIFKSGNTEQMRIDTSGRVTKPAQPFFYARKDNSQTPSNGQRVDFTAIVTNIGSHYNTSTSRFTAPIAGVYSFTAKIWQSKNGGAYASFDPRINGSLITGSAGAYYDGAISTGGNANYIVNFQYALNAGDYVDFGVGTPGTTTVDNSGYFCGFLLS
jgi:hypothetical protein